MTSNAKAQRAKHAAFKRFVAENPTLWEQFISEEYEKVGLTYSRRLTPEERKERDDSAMKAKNEQKIRKLAKESGIEVVIGRSEADIEREAALDARSEAEEVARDAADQA